MDNNLKNIGVAFALSTLVDDLSLTKFSLPILKDAKNGLYYIRSKDGKISQTINLNQEDLEEDGRNLLSQVLEYTYEQITGKEDIKFECKDKLNQDAAIVIVINQLKAQARNYYYNKLKSPDNKLTSSDKDALDNLGKKICTFHDVLYNNADELTKDFKVMEYGQTFIDETYGQQPIDLYALFKDSDIWHLEYAFDVASDFIDELISENPKYLQDFLEEFGDDFAYDNGDDYSINDMNEYNPYDMDQYNQYGIDEYDSSDIDDEDIDEDDMGYNI